MYRSSVCSTILVLIISGASNTLAGPGPVGWWKFDEGSGTTAGDSSGNNYDGTINETVSWIPGCVGPHALQLTSGYVRVSDRSQLRPSRFTVCAWVNLPAPQADYTSTVIYDGDANDITEQEWHEWNILLQDFNDDGVILTDVRQFVIGVDCTVLWGTIYFDDIRLYVPRCIAEFRPAADLSGDCIVDFKDFSILGSQWQQSPGIPSADVAAPLGLVEWGDLAVLVDGWLEEGLWPP